MQDATRSMPVFGSVVTLMLAVSCGQEFAEPDWEANEEDAEDEKLWEDDWDDDDADDEFVVQLRAELKKTAGSS